jgi:hypothetical protein
MADNQEPDRPFLTPLQSTKAYHRPGWEHYAAKVEAQREIERQNAQVVLREKRMNAGSTHYTFSIIQKKNTKPYLRVSVFVEKHNYRGTIVIFAPYVPAFLGILQELAKEFEL